MAVETKILNDSPDRSYTAPEGGFVGRLHGRIIIDLDADPVCNSLQETYVRISTQEEEEEEAYGLIEDVDYIEKRSGNIVTRLYPGVPIQLKENCTLEIVGDCPFSFILMGYIED
jgi:hypothetical protein